MSVVVRLLGLLLVILLLYSVNTEPSTQQKVNEDNINGHKT